MGMAYGLNTAWMWKCRREAHAFQRATAAVAEAQQAVLGAIITANRHSTFGQRYGFDSIATPRQFQARVPLATYDTYQEAIDRIAAGETHILTAEPVELLEPTSGTTRGAKLIPYTRALRRQFQGALAAWIWDLMWHRPAVRRGRAYWSISPAFGIPRHTAGGIPVGFDDDTAYLGGLERLALRSLLAVPPGVATLADIDNFRYCTLLHLLQAEDLALLSVWHPTFLVALLRQVEPWGERLIFDLRHHSLSLPHPDSEGAKALPRRRRSRTQRTAHLTQLLRAQLDLADKLHALWPRLTLISCWADGAAALFLPQLQQLFPTVEIQPKGLLATEGCVSFPLLGQPGAALALRSHFFEFEEWPGTQSSPPGDCRYAWQLERGGRYRVILTTGGGLYRYQMHDVVEVVGWVNQCPLLRFLGRGGDISDLVGEKLSEAHIRTVLERVFVAHALAPTFALLVPIIQPLPRYLLYVQDPLLAKAPALLQCVQSAVEAALHENPHYRYAIQLEQLQPVEIRLLSAHKPGWSIYESQCLALGQKAGNIKPKTLDAWTGWHAVFAQAGLVDFREGPIG